jgi:hypothetical protein
LLIPIRSAIRFSLKEKLKEETVESIDITHEKCCLFFGPDYDKENPLTSKKGEMRLIHL